MKTWIAKLDPTATLIAIALLVVSLVVVNKITDVELAKASAIKPILQPVGVPVYFTNTIVVIVPTNSVPVEKIITTP